MGHCRAANRIADVCETRRLEIRAVHGSRLAPGVRTHSTRPVWGSGSRSRGALRNFNALFVATLLLCLGVDTDARAAEMDSCVACHSDPELLVTNKKLYDYFQEWDGSVHDQEEVACTDCHGGDSHATDKTAAHGSAIGVSDPNSSVYYKAISKTCGQCHDEILKGFSESEHFGHVEKQDKEAKQGPTCVTCHNGMNVEVLNVNTVEKICARCHNVERDLSPEIPEQARGMLNRFLSIHRFYRYITTNAKSEEATAFLRSLDPQLRDLSVTWHTFDLESIEEQSGEVLKTLKAKRQEIRARRKSEPAR